ncbi:FG-GAP repeat domain-containing protein [Streptomyces sp. NPDC058486]|uniref:FG-GAP repeat domain-containing protein n=1 Tax=unclassified Streptomyces TaxID=2593676 RepID=UPI00364B0CC7
MRTAFSLRGRRVAACTALALSAGMLLATPASADAPTPAPVLPRQAPAEVLPSQPLAPAPAAGRAGAAAVSAANPLLSDFDGDGYEDTLFRTLNDEVYVATTTNTGYDGTFYRNNTELAKDLVTIGEQNGGGGPEVLVLNETGTLRLYQDSTYSGSYNESVVGSGWQVYNKVTSPGDLNRDGRADVLARTHSGELFLYTGTGRMNVPLSTRKRIGGGWAAYDQIAGVGDTNGDGVADLYARDFTGRLWFYAGTGNSTRPFATRKYIGGGWGVYNQLVAAGNGVLAARNNAGTVFLYRPRGGGVLSAPQQSGRVGGWRGVDQFANSGSVPYTGKGGLLARTNQGTLFWYGATSRGVLGPRDQIEDPGVFANIDYHHFSDLDGDGSSEMAVVHRGRLWIGSQDIGGGWDVYNSLVGTGDLTGDGRGDLLARDRSGVLYLYRGNGYGTAFSSRIRVGDGWSAYNKLVGAGDYTGDGRADLLARSRAGDLYVYAGTGRASAPFAVRKKVGGGWGAYKHLSAPGDLNSDGKADVLGVTFGGTLYRHMSTAPGKFAGRTKLATGFQVYDRIS